jgi:Na+-driven multidrug efflux pump
MIVLNNLLKKYGGTEGITIYGMINRLIMFALMPLFGLAQGQQPIVGYNYGARQYERVILTMKKTILIGTIMCIVGAVIMAIFPKPLLELFSSDPNLINEGIIALRIFIICFVLIGFQVVGTTMFLSIGKAVEALILAMSRQLIVLIPVVLLTSSIFGMFGIWIAFPISDGAAFLITLILYRRQMKKFKSILRI